MGDFLYNAGTALSPERGERTFQLLVPSDTLDVVPGCLYNSRLWVVVGNGGDYYLYARLYPISIESVETEIGEEILVLHADVSRSVYFLSSVENEKNGRYRITDLLNGSVKRRISEIPADMCVAFEDVVDSARRYVFSIELPALAEEKIANARAKGDVGILGRTAFETAKRTFSVADLARDARKRELDEYRCFVYHYLLRSGEFDETAIAKAVEGLPDASGAVIESRRPTVETELNAIDPNKVTARKFISPESGTAGDRWDAMMTATEKAEERHQTILREVAVYLLSLDLRPLESSSVDLAVRRREGLLIFEIKSATRDNFFRQCEKALSQILRYAYELEKVGESVVGKYLIVERCVSQQDETFIADFFGHCGVGVLCYDSSKEWPNRLCGLKKVAC